jgi:Cellobiose phosphorylase
VRAAQLAKTVDAQAWDGAWYRRAYFDDGTPLGSKENTEARIDSLPKRGPRFPVLATPIALRSRCDRLRKISCVEADDLILLFTPPFDKTAADVGYIKGYPPGVRENGGQYTHAATWVPMAFARQGDGDKAVRLLRMLNPVEHARDEKTANATRSSRMSSGRRLLVSGQCRARWLDLVHGRGSLDLSRLA